MAHTLISLISLIIIVSKSYVGSAFESFICNFLPILNPQKQIANIGVTPTIGAPIPLYSPKNP